MKKIVPGTLLLSIFIMASCQSSPHPDVSIRGNGTITLVADPTNSDQDISFFDLDNNEQAISDNTDIEFLASGGSTLFYVIKPINNAVSYYSEDAPVEFDACLDNIELYTTGNIPEIIPGNYICVLTNEKRLAVLHITNVAIDINGKATLQLEYLIWDEVVNQDGQ